MFVKKLKALFVTLFLSTLLVIAGCASTEHYHATGTNSTPEPGKIDKNKTHKKNEDSEESDDMERLD